MKINNLKKELIYNLIFKLFYFVPSLGLIYFLKEGDPNLTLKFNKILGYFFILRSIDFGFLYLRRNFKFKDFSLKIISFFWIFYFSAIFPILYYLIDDFFLIFLLIFSSIIFQETQLNLNKLQKSYLVNFSTQFSVFLFLILHYIGFSIPSNLLLISFIFVGLFLLIKSNYEISKRIEIISFNKKLIFDKEILVFSLINIVYVMYSEFASVGNTYLKGDEYNIVNSINRACLMLFGLVQVISNVSWNQYYSGFGQIDQYILKKKNIIFNLLLFFVLSLIFFLLIFIPVGIPDINIILITSLYCSFSILNIYISYFFYRIKNNFPILYMSIFELFFLFSFSFVLYNSINYFSFVLAISIFKFLVYYFTKINKLNFD